MISIIFSPLIFVNRLSQITEKVDFFKRKSQVTDGGGKAGSFSETSQERGSISQTFKSLEKSGNDTLERISESTLSEKADNDENMSQTLPKQQVPSRADELSVRLSKIDANIRRLSRAAEPIIPIIDTSSPKKDSFDISKRDLNFGKHTKKNRKSFKIDK